MANIFENTPVNKPYISPTPNEITLMAGYPNATGAVVDDTLCKQVKDCGFNSLSAVLGASYISSSLQNCYNNGLKLFINNATLRQCNNTISFVNQFKNSPGLGGWLLQVVSRDSEISNPDNVTPIPGDPTYCPNYQNYNTIYSVDPDHPVFIGINGDWDRDITYQSKSENFPSLIAKFQSQYQPSFWPWAYFPQLIGGEIPIDKRWAIFYKDLLYFSYISKYTCTPFWSFCLCQYFKSYYGYASLKPAISLLKQIIFSSLAYGAQGIYYYNYRQNTNSDNYSDAPIDSNGNKTEVWDMVKTVNEEVILYNSIFAGCEMIDCRHLTTNLYLKDVKLLTSAFGPIMNIEGSDLNILVSHIFNNNINYLIILSTSLLGTPQSFVVNFSPYWNILRVTNRNNHLLYLPVRSYSQNINLSAGEILIYTWS